MKPPRTLAQRRFERVKAAVKRLTLALEAETETVQDRLTVEDLGRELGFIERGNWS